MNRVYRLVWNRSLGVVQVASERARNPGSSSGTSAPRSPRRRPLALALAGLALAWVSAPAWSQTCMSSNPSACGAAGGVGGRTGRSPDGGSGNGTGGDGITWNPNTSETPGNTATNGVGGAGATAIFDADGYDLTSTGGSGGAVGATDDVSASVSGGTGGAGEDAPSVSPVGGGGGGGGAGVFISISNSTQTVASTVAITGGQGGQGGAADGESNFDPGAGGGGGAGVIIGAGANIVTFTNNGTLTGGRGGTGGYGGYAGSGGGGGDGLLVLGAGARVTNGAGATISGGAGGAPGAFQDGENLPGGYGGGGAGVNLVGVGATLTNSGTITGGGAGVSPVAGTSAQNGTPGVGLRAWGGAIVDDSGAIAGGSNSSTQADAVLFSGGGNQLVIESGASFTGNIVSTSGSDPATGDTLTLGGNANGSFNVSQDVGFANNTKIGDITWTLTGTGNAGINWTIEQGELIGTTSTFNGSITFASNGLGLSPTLDFDQATSGTFADVISGAGEVFKDGAGTVTLAGANTYTGGTTINAGTLQGDTTSLQGNIADNAALVFNQDTNGSYSGAISGVGTLTKTGTGTVTLLGTNTYTGGTTIAEGTLQVGTSSLQGNIANNAALVFDQDTDGSYAGVIAGTGTLTKTGAGTVTLLGINTYTGGTTVDEGTLQVDTSITGLTTVVSGGTLIAGDSSHAAATVGGDVSVNGGTLGGYGSVHGSVTLSNGGALTPGNALAIGTLTIDGDLTIGSGSQLNFDFGAPGSNFSTPGQSDHVVVDELNGAGGNLSIDSSTLNVNNLGSMGPGLYNLFTWDGTLAITGGGFAPPSGMTLQILTTDKQINLVDTQGLTLDEWDANGQASPSAMGGGRGTWSVSSDTWSDTTGQFVGPMAPQPGFAIFGGTAGTVTVDDTGGEVSVTGMQFVSDGYQLTGDAIDLVGQNGVAPVIRVSSGDTAVIANELDGTDGLNKTDGGTLVLTGTNLYTGTTTLSGGYLSVSSDANLGASTDALDFEGGTLEITGTGFQQTSRSIIWGSAGGGFDIDDAANTFTVTQALTGTGGLLKSGAGTLVLAGANTYSGGTIIDAGILQGDAASLQGSITDNATLVFAQTTSGSFSGSISGSGQLIKNGGGTLVLNGSNSYTGGTTISAGTLQGDASSLQGNIADNAALVFDQTSDGTYSGVISGSGSVTKTGSGTLSLTGANVYSGGTTISAGTLQGDTGSLQGNITDNATLVFDQASDGTYSSVISGSGSLTKTGAGTLILDGANTYTGGTTISAGALEVGDSNTASASIEGAVDVQGAGTLRGHGTVVGNVTSDGIVWPGGSMGTLTIQGNYTQNADGTLQLDVTPTQSSMLKVSGNASLSGTLDLIFAPGTYSSNKFDLVQAGSLSGTFNTVNGTVPGSLTSQISYGPTSAELVLAQASVKPLGGSLFGDLMRSVNVAGQQDMGSVLDVGLMSRGTQCDADHAAAMQNVTATCGNGAWAQYTGSNLSLDGSDGSNSTAFGLLGGADYAVGDVAHVGLQAGVGQVNGNDTLGGNDRVDNVHGGIYAYADAGPTVLSAVVDTMHSDYHFNRATGIGTATSTPDGNLLSAALQVAWPLQLAQWQLTPKAGVLYQRQTLDGFSETLTSSNPEAAGFPVDGTRSRYTALQPYAIMAIEHSFVAHGVTYVPEVSVGYRYDTHNAATPIVQVTSQDGTVFDLPGATQGRGMGTASARITAEAGASWSLYADYQGLFGSRLHDNALSLGFTKHF